MIVRRRQQQQQQPFGMCIATLSALWILAIGLSFVEIATAFVPTHLSLLSSTQLAAGEDAASITDFMAKAHEEKVKAMARVEDKYKGEIQELKARIDELEASSKQTTPTSGNSFAFPATNKDLTEKVEAYRIFISDYIVKSQDEKAKAVKTAEDKLIAKYEAIIEKLHAGSE